MRRAQYAMRIGRAVMAAGVAGIVSGIVFHLQGRAIIGPETSFMYASPDWQGYGIIIMAAGAAVTGAGYLASRG